MALFSVRSERASRGELGYSLLFRSFSGIHLMERSFGATVFTEPRIGYRMPKGETVEAEGA